MFWGRGWTWRGWHIEMVFCTIWRSWMVGVAVPKRFQRGAWEVCVDLGPLHWRVDWWRREAR